MKALFAALLLVSISLPVLANGQHQAATLTSRKSMTLNLDLYSTPETLDQAKMATALEAEIDQPLNDTLVTYKGDTTQLVGDIASSWDASNHGKTYTFHLRHNVKFWNGDPVTSHSFVDAFKRVLSKKIAAAYESFVRPAIVGSTAYFNGKASGISGITTPDDYTLVVNLTDDEPFFPYIMALDVFAPVDQAYINKVGNKAYAYKPMGCGPFKLESFKQGQSIVLVKNPNYFKPGLPTLDRINFTIDSNVQSAVLRFKQGKTGFIGRNYQAGLDSADYVSMSQSAKWKKDFLHMPENTLAFLNLNNALGPFKNKLVRQAVNYAVNKRRLVQLLNGRALAADQYVPPHIAGYEKQLPADAQYGYDPAKARQLLKEAGYPNGFSTELIVPPGTPQNLMESIQNDFKQVGITVSLRNVTLSVYGQYAQSGKAPMMYERWSQDFPDPYDFLNSFLSSANIANTINLSQYRNPQVDKYLNEAAVMKEGPARNAVYDKAQNIALSDAAMLPLYYPIRAAVVHSWVNGYSLSPVMLDPFRFISSSAH